MRAGDLERMAADEKRDGIGAFDTGVPCRGKCDGTLIENVQYRPRSGSSLPPVFGPYRGSFGRGTVKNYFCSTCGLIYRCLPETARKHELWKDPLDNEDGT
jgi:hypothetical protein